MMKKIFSFALLPVLLLSSLSSCVETRVEHGEDWAQTDQELNTWSAVNYFAANCMSVYYLWNEEIDDELSHWLRQEIGTNPFKKVQSLRYKQGGKDYDRWTEITDSYEEMTSSVGGVSTTYGCDIILMMLDQTRVCAVISVVYADSPASRAGLKRGDVIVLVNGAQMDKSNYYTLITEGFISSPSCRLGMMDGREITMSAVKMYEDPVVYHSIFPIGDKKVGYLVFNAFTLRAIDRLLGVCESFKAAGVEELILDLRYNGGGYVTTEEALASMLAPESNVRNGDIFQRQIFNKAVSDFYLKQDKDALNTRFKTKFEWKDGILPSTCDTRSGHLDLKRIYAIIDSGTASASESVLVGLMPYMDIRLIGGQSHGKFCTGVLRSAQEWYDDYKDQMKSELYAYRKYANDWGLYFMIGRYADRDGNCPAMPDGLKPQYEVEDRPDLGYDFGDERDPMLRQALILAGRTDLRETAASTRASEPAPVLMPRQIEKPIFGKRILSPVH